MRRQFSPTIRRAPRLGRHSCRARVFAQQAVVLFRIHDIVPQPGALGRQLQIDRDPGVLEPFVQPGEQDFARGARLADLTGEPRVEGGHRLLVVPPVVHPLGLEVRRPAR